MALIAFFSRPAAAAALVLAGGAALLTSCAGTLEDLEDHIEAQRGSAGAGTPSTGSGTPSTGSGTSDPTTTGTGPGTGTGGSDPGTTTGAGGSDPGTSTGAGGPTGCADAPSIVVQSCGLNGCHGAASAQANLNLSDGWETRIIGQPGSAACNGTTLVVPGDPEASLIYQKILPEPPCNSRMPLGPALPDEHIACIRDWIAALP